MRSISWMDLEHVTWKNSAIQHWSSPADKQSGPTLNVSPYKITYFSSSILLYVLMVLHAGGLYTCTERNYNLEKAEQLILFYINCPCTSLWCWERYRKILLGVEPKNSRTQVRWTYHWATEPRADKAVHTAQYSAQQNFVSLLTAEPYWGSLNCAKWITQL